MKVSLVIILIINSLATFAQTFTEKITREFSFEKKGSNNTLMIFNVSGDVKIEGYNGDKIIVEIDKKITGKTEARLAKGKEEIQLGVLDHADTIILFMEGACQEFGKGTRNKRNGNWHAASNGWGYQWNNDHNQRCPKEDNYEYELNFTIKVPASVNVLASTINNGDVEVTGTTAYLNAENINGSIRLKNISGVTRATTINGSVDINYSGNPSGDSRYYSLNGDINAYFKKGLAAQLTFKSFNGNFYSSVDDITPMAIKVEKFDKGDGIKYRVNGNRFKVREGGPLLDFETFNGDVFLREQ